MIGHANQMSFGVKAELQFASPLMLYVMEQMIAQMVMMSTLNSVVSFINNMSLEICRCNLV